MVQNNPVFEVIKAIVRKHIPDSDILLFGSRSRNEAHPDSDYDILIKTKKQFRVNEKITLKTMIRKELLNHGIRTDILIQSDNEIMKYRKLPGHIIRNLMKDAILL